MNKFFIFLGVLAVVLGVWYFGFRGSLIGKIIEEGDGFSVAKLVFKGDDGADIYGLLFFPDKKEYDVVIVLPGGGGTKESRRNYAELLLGMGYGAFVMDQRGIGETGGYVAGLEEDFESYLKGGKVYQFLMARDVVRAVSYLEKVRGVDEIAVLGESMGGRNAMISLGLDERIKGAVIISSAGYFGSLGNEVADRFLEYINPNSYVSRLKERRILFLHSIHDNVIPIEDAKKTFELSGGEKRFVEVSGEGCVHGYCEGMRESIEEELGLMFS